MSEFDSLREAPLPEWADKLAELIAEASAATKAKDDDERLAIAARLRAFVKASPFTLTGSDKLDALALDAAVRLADSVLDDAAERIKVRTSEFVSIKKQIDAVAAQAEHDVLVIQLAPARAAVDSLTQAIHAIEDLGSVLVEGPDDELKAKLMAALATLTSTSKAIAAQKSKLPE